MKKRAFIFILALTSLTVFVWAVVEFFLIGPLINNYYGSLGWGIFCLVACCAYSLWKCPREPIDDDDDDEDDDDTKS